jgi:hypothetical protein
MTPLDILQSGQAPTEAHDQGDHMTPLESAILSLVRLRAATRTGAASAECQRGQAIGELRQLERTGITVRARVLLRHLECGGMARRCLDRRRS